MSAMPVYAIVLALLGAVPGETTGWGTGEVVFQAYVDTTEHHEIFPVCAGQYTVEVSIIRVTSDPAGVLDNVASVDVCYDRSEGLTSGSYIEVSGTYSDGACPIPYCRRVQAAHIFKISGPDEEPPDGEDNPDIVSPTVVTGSAEATETTATLRATLTDSGGNDCRCRFTYWEYGGRHWQTEWIESQSTGTVFSQKIAGLTPETLYFYSVEAENSEEKSSGRIGSFYTLAETVPPISHPTVWSLDPDQIDTSSITMVADIARDISGPEEYLFDFVASPTGGAGGSDSPWQFDPSYTDVGLNPNHQYGYRVKARDGLGNETAYSAVRHAYSAIETPASIAFGEITTSSIQVKSSNALSGLNRGQSGLKLENVTAGKVSAWQQQNTFWTSDGLLPNTQYAFRAQARNGDGDPTALSPIAEIYTRAMVPTPVVFSNPTANSFLTHWGANGNPAGTQYWCENTASSANSGWITDTQWLDTDLSSNARHSYRVKARNGDGVETAFSNAVEKYSQVENPEGVVFGAITTSSIQVRSENTPSGLNQGQSGLRFENLTAGRMSPWRRDNSFWTSDGLAPNRLYDFRVQARNGDGEQTPFGPVGSAYTHANIPSGAVFMGITTRSIQVQWSPNANPPGTLTLCENVTAASDSGWTILTAWDCTGLQANTQYTFRVKAQNASGVETAFSAEARKYSAIETPSGVVFGTTTPGSIQVRSENTPAGLNRGGSGLRFENVTTGELSGWQQNNNFWTSAGLLPNTLYMFRAQARNGDGDETPYGSMNITYTQANAPLPADFSNVTDTGIRVNWASNGNPFGTLYRCQNVTSGADSGWISSLSWDCFDLVPFTTYSFRVKARNANGVETGWVTLGQSTTGYRSLTVRSSAGGTVVSPGENVFQYKPGTTVNLTANPQDGYHFTCWSGSAVEAGRVADPNAPQTTVLVDAHYTLVANFLRTRIYVDYRAKGAADGSSWTNAFTSLQDALDVAQRKNQILVSEGLYRPDVGKNRTRGDYTLSFVIPDGAALKGGYAGLGSTNPDTRNIVAYHTFLSGDLKGDDSAIRDVHDLYGELTRLDNSLHVVTAQDADSTTLLEGVVITGGNSHDGAGIQLISSDIVVAQCTIQENRSGRLSGDGHDGWGQGAGASCFFGSPTFLNCTFQLNWSGGWGGAVHSLRSNPTLRDCVFQANHAGLQGGALYVEDGSTAVLACTFQGNRSRDGGAVFAGGDANARLTNCGFLGNSGFGSGGAVFASGLSMAIVNGYFGGNLAFLDGGALSLSNGSGTLANCTFYRNVAEGALGGDALAVLGTRAELANCILWDQATPSIAVIALQGTADREAALTVSYSDVMGGAGGIVKKGTVSVTWGAKNLDRDPRFQNPAGTDGIVGTGDDNLRLVAGSPCIDAGNNAAVPADGDDLDSDGDLAERIALDAGGLARFVDDAATANTGTADLPAYPRIVDLGAFEFTR